MALTAEGTQPEERRTPVKSWLATVRSHRPPWLVLALILAMLLMALFPGLIAPHDPYKQSLLLRFQPPFFMEGGSFEYWLGTDALGRDVYSRIVHGARISLGVAALSIICGGIVGTIVGLVSGYAGGRTDAILMRITDSTLAFPMLLFAFLLAVTLGPSMQTVVIAVSLEIWARFARVVRGEVLGLRNANFVKLAKVAGASHVRIIARHIFPNVVNTLIVLLTLQVGWVIIVEASLSFLGAGVPPPTAAWGSMIAESRAHMMRAWWTAIAPGTALLLAVLAFSMLGDWLRDVFDPKLK